MSMSSLMKWRANTQCCVCGRSTDRGTWFESGQRNPFTGETPCCNFVCDRCQHDAQPARELLGARRRSRSELRVGFGELPLSEEREKERRYAATMRRKVEAWQMPPGNG